MMSLEDGEIYPYRDTIGPNIVPSNEQRQSEKKSGTTSINWDVVFGGIIQCA